MNKPYFCRNFFLIDCRHERLKNTIDLLLFYWENFYGFFESVLTVRSYDWQIVTVQTIQIIIIIIIINFCLRWRV